MKTLPLENSRSLLSRKNLLISIGGVAAAAILPDCSGQAMSPLTSAAAIKGLSASTLAAMQKIGMSEAIDVDGTVFRADGTISKPSSTRAVMDQAAPDPNCLQDCGEGSDGVTIIGIVSTAVTIGFVAPTTATDSFTVNGGIGPGGYQGLPQATGPRFTFPNVPPIPKCVADDGAAATAGWMMARYVASNAGNFTSAMVNAANQTIEEWGPAGAGFTAAAGLAFIGALLAEAGVAGVALALAGAGVTGVALWAMVSCYQHGTS